MTLSTQDKILIEQRIANKKKSTTTAYLLLIFLGSFGVHRFYLGKPRSTFVMLALSLIGCATLIFGAGGGLLEAIADLGTVASTVANYGTIFGVGLILLAIVFIWVIVDAFLVPTIIRQDHERLRQTFTLEAVAASSADHA